jgi:hypothetical protein
VTSRIAIATSAEFADLDDDGPVLLAALSARDIEAQPVVWTDPRADYASYELVVVRSTWDYQDRRDEYVAWAERVAATIQLANPAPVLRWNTDKTYLRTLAEAGLPVVETTWLEPGDTFTAPTSGEYVVKPAVSAGSRDTNRYVAGDHDELAAAHATALLAAGRTVMVQPYLHQIDTDGETALLFFNGELSHACRKGPLLQPAMAPVEGAYKEEEMTTRTPSPDERAVADQVLDALGSVPELDGLGRADLTYARVDLVPGADGAPVLLELELTEPSMWLIYDGTGGVDSAERFAAAIATRLR